MAIQMKLVEAIEQYLGEDDVSIRDGVHDWRPEDLMHAYMDSYAPQYSLSEQVAVTETSITFLDLDFEFESPLELKILRGCWESPEYFISYSEKYPYWDEEA